MHIKCKHKYLKVVSINVDDNSDLAQKYGVMSIPCLVMFKDGEEVKYTIGDFLKDALTKGVYDKLKQKCRVIIHGLDIEEDMSFLFYYFNFSYLDTFLYITFVDKIKDEE